MPYAVNVTCIVDLDDPDAAVAFVQAELAARLAGGAHPWQTEHPHLLPRWVLTSARRVAHLNERGEIVS
jgi:hypothetical protein